MSSTKKVIANPIAICITLLITTFFVKALDQIISQIMENSNAHRPVPATEEIIQKLPREVLIEGCEYCAHSIAPF